jgi:hypothetical protein
VGLVDGHANSHTVYEQLTEPFHNLLLTLVQGMRVDAGGDPDVAMAKDAADLGERHPQRQQERARRVAG